MFLKACQKAAALKKQLLIYLFHLETEIYAIMQIIEEGMVDIF